MTQVKICSSSVEDFLVTGDLFFIFIRKRDLGPVSDCAIQVVGELEQSFEKEGRTGASSDIVKVTDWVQPFRSVGILRRSHSLD